MTDFETVAVAEERSFAQENEELIEEYGPLVFDGSRWTFPTSAEGDRDD